MSTAWSIQVEPHEGSWQVTVSYLDAPVRCVVGVVSEAAGYAEGYRFLYLVHLGLASMAPAVEAHQLTSQEIEHLYLQGLNLFGLFV